MSNILAEDEDLIAEPRRRASRPFEKAVFAGRKGTPFIDFALVSELALSWQTDRDQPALDALVATFMPMIRNMADNTCRIHLCPDLREDMISEGVLQLISAVDRHDPDVGSPLYYFARYPIKGGMLRLCLDYAGPVRIGTTSDERKALGRFPKIERLFEATFQRMPEQREDDVAWIAGKLDCSMHVAQVALSVRQSRRVNIASVANELTARDTDLVDAAMTHERAVDFLRAAVLALIETPGRRPNYQKVLNAMLREEATAITAKRLNLSSERIGQIRRDIQTDMRSWLKARGISAATALA